MPILENPVFVISGASRVGKTSLARGLANALNLPIIAFGDYVRSQASLISDGAVPARRNLQDLGQRLVQEDPEAFCRGALLWGRFSLGQSVIFEGLRHFDLLPILRRLVGESPLKLIYIDAPANLRSSRWDGPITQDELARTDSHPVEAQLGQIRENADLIVDSRRGLEANIRFVVEWILEDYPGIWVSSHGAE